MPSEQITLQAPSVSEVMSAEPSDNAVVAQPVSRNESKLLPRCWSAWRSIATAFP